jgi:hypothetical protein
MKFSFLCWFFIAISVLQGVVDVTRAQDEQVHALLQQFSADYRLGKEVVRNQRDGVADSARQPGTIGELANEYRKLQARSTLLKAESLQAEGSRALFNLAGFRYLLVNLPEKPRDEDVAAAREYLRQRGRDYIKAISNEADLLKASQSIQAEQIALMKRLGLLASSYATAISQPNRKSFNVTIYPSQQGNLAYTQLINRSGKDLHHCLLMVTLVPGEETARMPLVPLMTRGALKEDAEGTPKALEYMRNISKAWYDLHRMQHTYPIYLPVWKRDEPLIFTLGDAPVVRYARSASLTLWSEEMSFENYDLRVHQYLLTTEVKSAAMNKMPLPPEVPGRGNGFQNFKKNLDATQTSRNDVTLKAGSRWRGTQNIIYSTNISRLFSLENRKKLPASPEKYDIDLKVAGREGKRFYGSVIMAGQKHDYEGLIEGTLVVIVTEKEGFFQHIYRGGIDARGQLILQGHGTHGEGYSMSGSAVLQQTGRSSR